MSPSIHLIFISWIFGYIILIVLVKIYNSRAKTKEDISPKEMTDEEFEKLLHKKLYRNSFYYLIISYTFYFYNLGSAILTGYIASNMISSNLKIILFNTDITFYLLPIFIALIIQICFQIFLYRIFNNWNKPLWQPLELLYPFIMMHIVLPFLYLFFYGLFGTNFILSNL